MYSRLVARRGRERGVGDADAAVRGVEHGVEALEPRLAVDEVKTLAAVRANVADDEVDAVRVSTDRGVKRALEGGVCQCQARGGVDVERRRTGKIWALAVNSKLTCGADMSAKAAGTDGRGARLPR